MINHGQNCSIARDNSHSGSIACVAHCWQAVGRVDRAVRPILDEYTRRDLPGGAGLPGGEIRGNYVIPGLRDRPANSLIRAVVLSAYAEFVTN